MSVWIWLHFYWKKLLLPLSGDKVLNALLQSCGASSTFARLRRLRRLRQTWRNLVSRKPKAEVTSWGFESVVLFCVEIKVPAIILSNLRRSIKLALNWHWGVHANYVRLLLMIAMHRLGLNLASLISFYTWRIFVKRQQQETAFGFQ